MNAQRKCGSGERGEGERRLGRNQKLFQNNQSVYQTFMGLHWVHLPGQRSFSQVTLTGRYGPAPLPVPF